MGCCIALHAANRCDPLREPVVLIEKSQLGAGSSGLSSGILFQSYSERALAGISRDALKVYQSFETSTGRSVGFRRTGVLTLASSRTPEALERLQESLEMQESIGIEIRRVEAAEIRALVEGIEVDDEAVGTWEPGGGFVDPARTIEAFATLARNAGAVTRVGVKDSMVEVANGKVLGIRTSEGLFEAPNVVLCVGPWTPPILEQLGVGWPLRLVQTDQHFFRMPAVRSLEEEESEAWGDAEGAMSDLETRFTPSPLDRRPVPHPVIFDLDNGFSARCEPATDRTRLGRIRFAGAKSLSAEQEPELEPGASDWAREVLAKRLPMYRDSEPVGGKAYRIVLTPDSQPVVGSVEGIEGLYVVAGFSGNDFQLAPSIGEGLAQMVLEQPISAFDPDFFSPNRFA